MTKGPQPTTHNAERGAHSTCREKSETGSSPKRTEKKGCCSPIKKCFGDVGKTCSVIWRNRVRRFGEIMIGDLEKSCLVIWRNRVRRFGEIVFGDLEKSCSAIWRNRVR